MEVCKKNKFRWYFHRIKWSYRSQTKSMVVFKNLLNLFLELNQKTVRMGKFVKRKDTDLSNKRIRN